MSRPPADCALGSVGVVTPLNNPGGPEGDTVTVAEKLLNTEYWAILRPSINSVKRSKTLPTGIFGTSRPRGWGLLVTERCVLNHHNRTGSFKTKRFEIFCSDPFTHQPGEWPERYAAPRASLDEVVRAGTEQTTPRGLGAAVSGFGGPYTLPLRRRRCDARA